MPNKKTITVKVRASTRERIKRLEPGLTADEAINSGLDALERERMRRLMREQSRAVRADLLDAAEMASIREDLTNLSER